jgi:hypothetical protein
MSSLAKEPALGSKTPVRQTKDQDAARGTMNKSAFGFNQLTPKSIAQLELEHENYRERERRHLQEYPDHA